MIDKIEKIPALVLVIFYVCATIIVMSIIGLVKGPTVAKVHHHFDNATVAAQLKFKDNPSRKVIYITDESKNSEVYQSMSKGICEVKNFNSYNLNKKLKDYNCTYNKRDIGKPLIVEKSSLSLSENNG